MMRHPLLIALLMLLPAPLLAVPISEILFAGNAITRESVLRQELLLREGDEADSQLIEESRQAIMNLGLFKSVASRLEEDPQNGSMARRLIFTVEERYFLLPVPLLGAKAKNDNVAEGLGSVSYGFDLRYNNVMGLNHRLQLIYETEDFQDTGGDSRTESALKYDIPRLIGTPYQLNLSAKKVVRDINEYEDALLTGSYHQETNSGSFYLSRWLNAQAISRGWRAGAGLAVTVVHYDEQSGSALAYESGQSVTLNAGVSFEAVNEFPYHREGEQYGYALALGVPPLGSESAFHHHELFHRRYRPVQFADGNLNTQVRLKLANGTGTTYSVGNSELLRGYENDYAEGNAMLLVNLEYHHHLSGYRQLRGVLFTDFGNAWPDISRIDLSTMPAGVGVGLRWRVQSFVDITLRVDYAMALAAGTSMLTLNTKASF
ncbi:MAG: BamA/TamA family outer membrane protein [Gammaproteobacteria bacterium]|nr:BamA/TamA family outer membrane protein [Gammaproteobacteria bacterium]